MLRDVSVWQNDRGGANRLKIQKLEFSHSLRYHHEQASNPDMECGVKYSEVGHMYTIGVEAICLLSLSPSRPKFKKRPVWACITSPIQTPLWMAALHSRGNLTSTMYR